jgi:methylmalonyl-CoA/ethylmalonyl-CoA epimerase
MHFFNDGRRLPSLEHLNVEVKDLDKAMELFNLIFGEKDWEIHEYAGTAEDSPVGEAFNLRYAVCKLGDTDAKIELMQPITYGGAWSRFLDEKGEGLHHICFTTSDYDEDVARITDRGSKIIAGGIWKGIRWCYIELNPTGLVLELIEEKTKAAE